MGEAGPGPYADRTRGLIAVLWRAGLRIGEALALTDGSAQFLRVLMNRCANRSRTHRRARARGRDRGTPAAPTAPGRQVSRPR
jgi:hypothetical protein